MVISNFFLLSIFSSYSIFIILTLNRLLLVLCSNYFVCQFASPRRHRALYFLYEKSLNTKPLCGMIVAKHFSLWPHLTLCFFMLRKHELAYARITLPRFKPSLIPATWSIFFLAWNLCLILLTFVVNTV